MAGALAADAFLAVGFLAAGLCAEAPPFLARVPFPPGAGSATASLRGEGTGVPPAAGAAPASACWMFTSTRWSCCTAASCSCSATISAPIRSCSLALLSRSLATRAAYCEATSVVADVSDMMLVLLGA
ncbi:hypothetical protein AUW26_00240 [Streptomyces sp. CC71]|nr:hypothetical protein AUW26_00240 [Streptomyces sp. CC71]